MNKLLSTKMNNVLIALVAILFVFSAVAKLFPIQAFELLLISQGLFNWQNVQLFSRALISIELIIGFGLLLPYKHRSFFYSAALFLLAVFSVQLVFSILRGDTENCGCFGTLLPMTPIQALIKNIIAIGILSYLKYRTAAGEREMPLSIMSFGVVIPVMIMSMFPTIEPSVKTLQEPSKQQEDTVPQKTLKQYLKEKREQEFNSADSNYRVIAQSPKKQITPEEQLLQRYTPTTSAFAEFTQLDSGEKLNPDKGIKVFAVLSLDCDHCKKAAEHFKELKSAGALPYKTLFILFGEQNQFEWFFGNSNPTFPYVIVGPERFFPLLSAAPPRVVLLVNGNVVRSLEGNAVNKEAIVNLLQSKK